MFRIALWLRSTGTDVSSNGSRAGGMLASDPTKTAVEVDPPLGVQLG